MPYRKDKVNPSPPSTGELTEDPPSVEIGHDGKIDGIYRPRDHRRGWTSQDEAQFELRERSRAPHAAPPEAPPPRQPQTWPRKALLALAVVVAALLAARWGLQAWSSKPLPKASGLIIIDSVPSNARVFLDDKEVGRTPYVAPNTFEPGTTISTRILYPGAHEWTGTFPGGVDTSFTAELRAQSLPPQ